jgi:hypothetical protein
MNGTPRIELDAEAWEQIIIRNLTTNISLRDSDAV